MLEPGGANAGGLAQQRRHSPLRRLCWRKSAAGEELEAAEGHTGGSRRDPGRMLCLTALPVHVRLLTPRVLAVLRQLKGFCSACLAPWGAPEAGTGYERPWWHREASQQGLGLTDGHLGGEGSPSEDGNPVKKDK